MRRLRSTVLLTLLTSVLLCLPAVAQHHFANVTVEAGITGQAGLGHAVGWCDLDLDGDPDLAFSNQDGSDFWLYRNDGQGQFTDVTAAAGLAGAHASKILWGELTGDQHADLLLTSGGARLYRNDGGVFVDITGASGLSGYPKALSDVDGDGLLDVITSSGDQLRWHPGRGDGTFDAPRPVGTATSAWTSVCFDYDRDGDDDLYIGTYGATANRLFANQGDGTFSEVAAQAGVSFPHASHGLTVGDYDNDGWVDLYVGGYSAQRCRLFRNLGDGTFADVTDAAGVLAYPDTRTVSFVDMDNDGWLDIFASHHDFYSYSNVLWRNQGDGTFVDVAVDLGLSGQFIGDYFGVGWADFDGDGAVDLFTAGHIDRYRLWQNRQCPGNSLHLDLVGTLSNRSAIGARAVVHAGDHAWTRLVTAGSGRQDFGSLTLAFGLGQATAVDSVVVWWPGGVVQRLGALAANQTLTVVEPADPTAVGHELWPAATDLRLAAVPNPCNPRTEVRFELPASLEVRLTVHDLRGRLVRTLVSGRLDAGAHAVDWDGADGLGRERASGVYLVVLAGDGVRTSQRITLVR